MASVQLDTVLLALAADPAQQVQLEVTKLDEDAGVLGEVRRYANGRRRLVTRAGGSRTIALTFDTATNRPVISTLLGWAGQVVLFRDPYGRKAFCVFLRVPSSERIPVDWPEVTLTLEEITYPEAV